jgi:Glyoxalase/Bleomycin resistance protein/Dioxygenase superfamily
VAMGFGPIWQLGYVVSDLDAALEHWLAAGVGPWYVFDPLPVDRFCYRGGPSIVPDVVVALAYSGATQVELIHQRDQAPTLYRDFLATNGEGLQHLGFRPGDYDGALTSAVANGWEVAHEGAAAGTRFVYLDAGSHAGSVTELVDLDPRSTSLFAHMASEAATWDGLTRPIRPLSKTR